MLHGSVRPTTPQPCPNAPLIIPQIGDDDSTLIVAQLLFLEAEDSTKPIHLYINSPGGSVTAGLAIYDTVRFPSGLVTMFSFHYAIIPDAGE